MHAIERFFMSIIETYTTERFPTVITKYFTILESALGAITEALRTVARLRFEMETAMSSQGSFMVLRETGYAKKGPAFFAVDIRRPIRAC